MTAIASVKTAAQNVADVLGGWLSAATATVDPKASATREAKMATRDTVGTFFDSGMVFWSVLALSMLLSGDSEKSTARRLGEGSLMGLTATLVLWLYRGVR